MKKRIEREITYWKKGYTGKLKEKVETIGKILSDSEELRVDYKDCIQFRYVDEHYDKAKITFKVNHGELLYRKNFKNRVSSINEAVQIYEEKLGEWKSVDELQEVTFLESLIAAYYKESYIVEILFHGHKVKIIGHAIAFLNSNLKIKNHAEYIEIESEKFTESDIMMYEKIMESEEYIHLSFDNCKVKLGSLAIGDNNKLNINNIEELKKELYGIFITNACFRFQ